MASNHRPHGDTQQRILAYIEQVVAEKGYPPSVREIRDAVSLSSTSTVHGHLCRMEAKGLLRRDAMKPRAMGLSSVLNNTETDGDENNRFSQLKESKNKELTVIPVIGDVAAGFPIIAEEFVEDYVQLPECMLGNGKHFILKVHGDSMINCGIMDGDYVVVHQQKRANNGDIVVALIDGNATVKRFFKEAGRIRLQPENDNMAPIYVDDLIIEGKVVSSYRLY